MVLTGGLNKNQPIVCGDFEIIWQTKEKEILVFLKNARCKRNFMTAPIFLRGLSHDTYALRTKESWRCAHTHTLSVDPFTIEAAEVFASSGDSLTNRHGFAASNRRTLVLMFMCATLCWGNSWRISVRQTYFIRCCEALFNLSTTRIKWNTPAICR